MKKYKIQKRMIMLFSLTALLISTIQITLGVIVTKTDSLVNTFTPFESIINNLFISKTVEHPFGENYEIPDNIEFDFKVDLGNNYAASKISTTNGEKIADANGAITITTKPGASVGIKGIEEGTKVSVTEVLKNGSGFTVKDGIATKEATVLADGNVVVDFVNVYTPAKIQPTNLNVSGNIDLEGRDWKEGDKFEFELFQSDVARSWKSISKKTVTYDASNKNFNKFNFSDIIHTLQFDKAGTYSFRISQVVGNILGITYDKNVSEFSVVVGDKDMDGKLEVQKVTATENTTVTKDEASNIYNIVANFKNKFKMPDIEDVKDIEVPITVNKNMTIIGTSSMSPEGFEFKLENKDTKDIITSKSDANGIAQFYLKFTKDDIDKTYNYKLSEINDDREGVTYSTSVYDIQINIALNEENILKATVICNDKEVKEAIVEFENIYDSSDDGEDENKPPTDEDDESEEDNDKPSTDEDVKPPTDSDDNETSAPTGDNSQVMIYALIAVVSITIYIIRKVTQSKNN